MRCEHIRKRVVILRFSIYRSSKKQHKSNILTKNPLLEENNEAGKSFDQKREKKIGSCQFDSREWVEGFQRRQNLLPKQGKAWFTVQLKLGSWVKVFFELWRRDVVFTKKESERVACCIVFSTEKFLMIFSPQKSEKNSVVGIFLWPNWKSVVQ